MEWCNSVAINLINLYRERECLWNPADDDYKSKFKKTEAWNEISQIMECEVIEVKKKMESLLSSFRRERQKQTEISRVDEVFESTWFAFKHMTFLMDKFTPRKPKNIEEFFPKSNNEDQEEDSIMDNEQVDDDTQDKDKQEIEEVSEQVPEKKTNFKSFKRDSYVTNSKIDKAYAILKDTVAMRNIRDDSMIYGEHVASKHRKYSAHTRSVIEHLIGDILFNADMGHYESHVFSLPSGSPKRKFRNKRRLN
ncbi:hypothetical protein PV327_009910 [Microctonus hyperodae]|uniref:MADF domain-containing protein n=1 Tax=Microctonus hyperodae TaxID=165561 RepID=A0AA39KG37_MICHY|nr:hypothetical protein PV327_009910 [Microctonus hyperodae]